MRPITFIAALATALMFISIMVASICVGTVIGIERGVSRAMLWTQQGRISISTGGSSSRVETLRLQEGPAVEQLDKEQNGTSLQPTTSTVKLFVGVISRSTNTERRDAIRQTWGSDPRLERVVFVVAHPTKEHELKALRREATHHKDIVFVGHKYEHYDSITHQSLEVFRAAAAYHGPITHAMKCDDDSFVNVGPLLNHLSGLPFKLNAVGNFAPFNPQRDPDSQWFTPYEVWPDTQPEVQFAYGAGYALTRDVAALIATGGATGVNCGPGRLFRLEDVAMGIWLHCLRQEGLDIALNPAAFNNLGCEPGDIVSHYQDEVQMRCMYANAGRCCEKDGSLVQQVVL